MTALGKAGWCLPDEEGGSGGGGGRGGGGGALVMSGAPTEKVFV
jgi:hypothetical protein